jgi:hypothetical protein
VSGFDELAKKMGSDQYPDPIFFNIFNG